MKIDNITKPSHLRGLEEDKIEYQKHDIERDYKKLEKKYTQSLEQIKAVDRLIATAEQYMKAYAPVAVKPHKRPKTTNGASESAVLVLSDSHVGKVVYPNQTLGFGHYNFPIFLDRLYYIENRVRTILHEHVNTVIDELVIFLLGDMLDGRLQHAKEEIESSTFFDQWYAATHCFAQMIRNIAQDVPRVRVYTAVGNHTRLPNQHKMPTEQRYSNFDHFLYAGIQMLLVDQPNVHINLDRQPFCYTDIKGSKILGMHGDHLRGGDKQMGVPIHGISRQISGITQLYEREGMEAPHYWLMGDKHKDISLPTVKGKFLVNGSFVGDDNFSLTLSTSSEPQQLFFGMHPKYRMTWRYDLSLKHAPINKTSPYQIPKGTREYLH
jgi:hypothetical protein